MAKEKLYRQPEEIRVGNRTLREVLDLHKEWVESGEERGEQAILSNEKFDRVNLRGENLTRINLSHTKLNGVNLQWAILRGADLGKATIIDSDLSNGDFSGGSLEGATVKRSTFRGTNFSIANLNNVELNNVSFDYANASKSNFKNSKIFFSNFTKSDFRNVNFVGSIFGGMLIHDCDLAGAVLYEANLFGCHFIDTRLDGCRFGRSDLTKANFHNSSIKNVDFLGAKMTQINFVGVSLVGYNFSDINLSEGNFSDSDLTKVSFRGSNLQNVTFSRAVLSQVIVSPDILGQNIKGNIKKGINGIYSPDTDSAALFPINPKGDSMLTDEPGTVVDNLKRARQFLGISLSAILIMVYFILRKGAFEFWGAIPGESSELISFFGLKLDGAIFSQIALPITTVIVLMAGMFFQEALNGARHIQTRDGAMKVGSFPWALSRYAKGGLPEKALSLLLRGLLSFHGCLLFLLYWQFQGAWLMVFWTCAVLILLGSVWIFRTSQEFQRPILFDPATERERQERSQRERKQQSEFQEQILNRLDSLEGAIRSLKDSNADPDTQSE